MANPTANKVLVGCRLPHGLHISLNGVHVRLNGLNSSPVAIPYATTPVDADFATAWFKQNKSWAPVASGAIFLAKDEASLAAVGAEVAGEKTGLERLDPEAPIGKGAETDTVKPATEDD